ncbi:MAG: DUF3445 domain-containing protein [Cyanobacteria bacterium P01_A01_bin.114]
MGLKPLALADWLEIDGQLNAHLACKADLLAERHQDVFVALPDTQSAQTEVLNLVTAHLLQTFPEIYQPLEQGICNLKTGQAWKFETFADAPLDLVGRLVQEDFCLLLLENLLPENLLPAKESYILSAASVCFPLRWTLREKIGQPVGQIHQRVPSYAQKLERPVDNVFARLRDGFPSLRFNWSIVDSPELYLAQNKFATGFNPAITAENAGQSLWLRVERQTLRRLPNSRGVLFTIRTYIYPLDKVVANPTIAKQLAAAIEALLPDMQIYKNLLPFRQSLLAYLEGVYRISCPYP